MPRVSSLGRVSCWSELALGGAVAVAVVPAE